MQLCAIHTIELMLMYSMTRLAHKFNIDAVYLLPVLPSHKTRYWTVQLRLCNNN
jgi:hypothetical protein